MAKLLLGPLLRHVGERDATVWVETDTPCEVEVRAGFVSGHQRTFTIAGHYYALVVLTGLELGSSTPYVVRLDGDIVWPTSDSTFPPSRIRTVDPSRPIRLLFGSCREPSPGRRRGATHPAPDVLDAYAQRDVERARDVWERDVELDALEDSVFRDLLTHMMEDPRNISFCAHLLFCSKNIERIGDHATNIAETVVYLVTGSTLPTERPHGRPGADIETAQGAIK